MPSKKRSSTTSSEFLASAPDLPNDREGFKKSILQHLTRTLARDTTTAKPRDWWLSTCYAVRDRMLERFLKTMEAHNQARTRRVYYLSLEYLMGRLLGNNLLASGLYDTAKEALAELGHDLELIENEEYDMGLGNGGLGRLAACFLDSLATLDLPAVGYGIHYEFGLFKQEIVLGRQVERADNWLRFGNPWQVVRPEYTVTVRAYGHVEQVFDPQGEGRPAWKGGRTYLGVPWDIVICGYGARTINFLRLWESRAGQDFDFQAFNEGGYIDAVLEKAQRETVSKVLYPNDKTEMGKELRLVQQYFFVSCSLQDIIRRFLKAKPTWDEFPELVAVQLNDTHPALAVPELMRLLVDDHGLTWDHAWSLTRRTFGYTNHTLLPEALERWSVPLFEKVLPRHLQIIFEINRRFLEEEVEAKWPGDDAKKRDLSLIEEGHPKMVRMAYLSVVGSHAVNGVAAMHTRLLKANLFPDFDALYPGKFRNKTNGITPRRFLKLSNPGLSQLITETIGSGWETDLDRLQELDMSAEDASFRDRFLAIKRANKVRLAQIVAERCGVVISPDALFDVQIKRLHEYKRQHLNLLHILALYRRMLRQPDYPWHPRVFLFGAKAAPGYELAKNIIHAINAVAFKINNDPRVGDRLKVIFIPNYGVTLAERIIPAADLSEQISTAGKEASGTGNMKFALNGAVTIGTLDGANVEIKDAVGDDNIFIFGHTVEEVVAMQAKGYNPFDAYYADEELHHVVDWISSDYFCEDQPGAFMPLRRSILDHGDPFLVLADFRAYAEAQNDADAAFRDRTRWARMAIRNTARVGMFSSDRTIREYAEDIWKLKPVRVG